jgi:hypothetical protein
MNVRFGLVLLLLAPLLVVAAPRKSELLIGRWHYAGEKESCTYTFRSDGTFAGEVSGKSKVVWIFAGKWSISGDIVHYEYTQSSVDGLPIRNPDDDKLLEIGRDHFVIVAFDGSHRKYQRVDTPKERSH